MNPHRDPEEILWDAVDRYRPRLWGVVALSLGLVIATTIAGEYGAPAVVVTVLARLFVGVWTAVWLGGGVCALRVAASCRCDPQTAATRSALAVHVVLGVWAFLTLAEGVLPLLRGLLQHGLGVSG